MAGLVLRQRSINVGRCVTHVASACLLPLCLHIDQGFVIVNMGEGWGSIRVRDKYQNMFWSLCVDLSKIPKL